MLRSLSHWKDISVSKKLYAVVGIMAVLIVGELFTLSLTMRTLSAVRAFVGGEGLWSKAQKNAALSLMRYASTNDELDYQQFLYELRVPEGDHRARIELEKPHPNMQVIREGFLEGRIHPDDIQLMVELLRRFLWVSHIRRAVDVWTEGDALLEQFKKAGSDFHRTHERARLEEVVALNQKLTQVEDEFSKTLGEGSRWLESVIFSLLCLAVLMVESVGLTLTFLTSRSISRGLRDIQSAAEAIGRGQFSRSLKITSRDEIGRLAEAVNHMGALLDQTYRDLEARVQARTHELANAVEARDRFLSIASHELKTPLTALKLQAQVRKKAISQGDLSRFTPERLKKMSEDDEKQVNRLTRLVDDMLDISHLNTGKFSVELEEFDLGDLVCEVVERFSLQLHAAGCEVSMNLQPGVRGMWDHYRLEQVMVNLLTNAMKYGAGKPVDICLKVEDGMARLSVRDHGIGIATEDQQRIFEQFERAVSSRDFSGLGLGLYIVKRIVEEHRGLVAVRSQVGAGAEFDVRIPCKQPDSSKTATQSG
jgi:signal transduction histidine kinase